MIIRQLTHNLREAGFTANIIFSLYLLVALLAYHPADPGWSHTLDSGEVHNAAGRWGAWIADVLLYAFGYFGYLLPLVLLYAAWQLYQLSAEGRYFDPLGFATRIGGLVALFLGGTALGWMYFITGEGLPHGVRGAGGIVGDGIGHILLRSFGPLGGTLVGLALFFIGVTLYVGLSWLHLADVIGHWLFRFGAVMKISARGWLQGMVVMWRYRKHRVQEVADEQLGRRVRMEREQQLAEEMEQQEERKPPTIAPVAVSPEPGMRVKREQQQEIFHRPAARRIPSLSILDKPAQQGVQYSKEDLETISRQVELKLKDFGVSAMVTGVCPGPVITRFELELAPGVKVSQVSNLAKDLARSLSVVSVRIVEVIPGKSYIGLEIPNQQRDTVWLHEILSSKEYEAVKSPLALGLGKDINGRPVVTDLAKMPHLLVAGTTGSGKSVALNAMILSLLYKASAEELRLILIDPKMLELSVYQGIPHLLASVVTDTKKAPNALNWAVAEMERRYQLMASQGVRNIHGYNKKLKDAIARGEPLYDTTQATQDEQTEPVLLEDPMPFIVIVIDELADMMMTAGKKVEELIARLAQKARAAGIHLILATQRPSVDVITGLIKANIPCRIAFQVSSKIDSRTILDQMGAENLLGYGDMLFLSQGSNITERVHGVFVSDEEVHRVVEEIKVEEPEYNEDILTGSSVDGNMHGVGNEMEGEKDPLYDQAVNIVIESRKASISYIQRRLKIGYNRAARLVEDMERAGLVSESGSNGSREVLLPAQPED